MSPPKPCPHCGGNGWDPDKGRAADPEIEATIALILDMQGFIATLGSYMPEERADILRREIERRG